MSYPNRDRRSNYRRHRDRTEVGYSSKLNWETHHDITRQARKALGLGTRDRYAKDETAQGVMPDGRPVKLVVAQRQSPRTSYSGRRTGMGMRRIQILCDQCNHWIPVGRINQHEGTATCLRMRNRKRTTRDPSKRRIVHGRAVHGEATHHHAPASRQEETQEYLLHWYSPEDRRDHATTWRGSSNFAKARREAEEHCDRSEAKRFVRLEKVGGHASRDPGRATKKRVLAMKASGYVSRGRAAEDAGHFSAAAVWYRKAAVAYTKAGSNLRAKLWKNRAKDVNSSKQEMGTTYRGERKPWHTKKPLGSRKRPSRDIDLREMSIQALGRLLIKALRSGHDVLAHRIEKEIERRSRRR